jgi:hypothetical protein
VGCRWIHFNGGEISLIDYVPDAVALAHSKGIRVSATSNGTGDIEFYGRLVRSGIGDLHISFDTVDQSAFDKTSRIEGAWHRVRRTLEYLCRDARSINPGLRVIANLTLHNDAIRNIVETIEFLAGLPVDDIKLQSSRTIEEWPDELREAFIDTSLPRLERAVSAKTGFPLLKARLSSLTQKAIQGSRNDPLRILFGGACEVQCQQHMLRKDGAISPCFIYMRENYKRPDFGLGDIDSALAEWKAKAVAENAARYATDETCRRHCPDFVADLNTSAKRLVSCAIEGALENSGEGAGGTTLGETAVQYSMLSNVGAHRGPRRVLVPLWTPEVERHYYGRGFSGADAILPATRDVVAPAPGGTFDRLVADKVCYQFAIESGIRCLVADEQKTGGACPMVDAKASVLARYTGGDGRRRTATLRLPKAIQVGGD